jgi:AraC-like DNA-binding protein
MRKRDVWSESRNRYVTIAAFWRQYKQPINTATIADLAKDARISPSCMSAKFIEVYGDKYKDIAESRRSGKTQRLLTDETYEKTFQRYRSIEKPTLKELGNELNISATRLSYHFKRLFGPLYDDVANERRAHVPTRR